MDPNEALRQTLEAALRIVHNDQDPYDYPAGAVKTLVDHVLALDAWLVKGGSLPERWTTGLHTECRNNIDKHKKFIGDLAEAIGFPNLEDYANEEDALAAVREKLRVEHPEQLFEVRIHCDGSICTVGRYLGYANALNHVNVLKSKRQKELDLLGVDAVDVVPVAVLP